MAEISRSKIGDIEVLKCRGELTIKNAHVFKEHIYNFLEVDSEKLLLDFNDVSYINSAALGNIADVVLKAKKNNKNFVIGGLQPNIQEIFKIIRFELFITLFNDVNEAIEYLKK